MKNNSSFKTLFQLAYFLIGLGIFIAYIDFEKTIYGFSVKRLVIILIFLMLFNMLRDLKGMINNGNNQNK